jgi:transcription antitermination factor NusG
MEPQPDFDWYVARTASRSELRASQEIEKEGFEVFVPQVVSPDRPEGHEVTPLFPGYIFVRCPNERELWPRFRAGCKIWGWVMFGDQIPCLPGRVISDLKGRWDEINRDGGLWRRFRTGEQVRVVSSGMEGLAQVLEESKSPNANVRILMEFMGRRVKTQVPWKNLRALDGQPPHPPRAPRRTRGRNRWVRGHGPMTRSQV